MDDKLYIQHSNGDVYKVMKDHYLKISPWEYGEDRRVTEMETDEYRVITYKNAMMIVNNQFDNKVEEWQFNDKKFIANAIGSNKNIKEYSYLLSTLPNHSLSIQNNDGSSEFKMIKHKGKIYYILIVQNYLPRVQAFNMMGDFVQWVGIDHCKPIFCETDNRYL